MEKLIEEVKEIDLVELERLFNRIKVGKEEKRFYNNLESRVDKFLLETAISDGVLERGKLEEMKLSEKLEWAKQIIESCEGMIE